MNRRRVGGCVWLGLKSGIIAFLMFKLTTVVDTIALFIWLFAPKPSENKRIYEQMSPTQEPANVIHSEHRTANSVATYRELMGSTSTAISTPFGNSSTLATESQTSRTRSTVAAAICR